MHEILGFRGLRNLNASEHPNYPAIDLADFGARIAVQVTATATLSKIRGTIGKFLKHGQQESFDAGRKFYSRSRRKYWTTAPMPKTMAGNRIATAIGGRYRASTPMSPACLPMRQRGAR